jgi:hypothetical protein
MFRMLMSPELPLARVASEGSTVIGRATATAEKMTNLIWSLDSVLLGTLVRATISVSLTSYAHLAPHLPISEASQLYSSVPGLCDCKNRVDCPHRITLCPPAANLCQYI